MSSYREWFTQLRREELSRGGTPDFLDPLDWAGDWKKGVPPAEALDRDDVGLCQ